jgi:porin
VRRVQIRSSRIGLIVGWAICALAGLLAGMSSALAQQETANELGITPPSIASSLPRNGDPGGVRKWLHERGVDYTVIYTNDVLSNVAGGNQRGTIDQGKVEAILKVDLEKLAGQRGLSFFANAFQIDNTGRIRRDLVGGINTIAAIEAVPTTRLSEIWFEQKFAGGAASLRVGQLAADVEFFFAGLSDLFLQSDWPTITAVNLPSGGAAYPLSTPGVRLKIDPSQNLSFLFAVLNGDPAGPGPGDEQVRNRHGLNFRIGDPPFIIGEAQWRVNQGNNDTGLAATYKLGAWGHLGEFEDRRFATDGTLLANPLGSGMPKLQRGNSGVYGVIEQQVYRPAGGGPDSGVSVFSRISASPSDRNLVDFYVDGGMVFAGLIPGRPNDRFGVGVIYARFSDGVRAFDRDTATFTGVAVPVRDFEANLELTYRAEIVSGWTVQPVLTHIWHPSGFAGRDATVVGVRSIVRY